jgi:electron transport complex protein RnfB
VARRSRRLSVTVPPVQDSSPPLVERLDRLLPQTQCGQCGYAGCRPYADAMARGEAGIDHCPPGGDAGARALARVLGVPAKPYDRSRGEQLPPQVAVVVEADCIGCTKCIQACPVDAIVGASKAMHVVIDPLCTGCALCVPACPVDCIVMELLPQPAVARSQEMGSE